MAHLKWIYHWKWWFSIATFYYQRVYHIISYLRSINLSCDLFLIYVRYWWWAPPFMELELWWEIRDTPRETMGIWGLGLGYPTFNFFSDKLNQMCAPSQVLVDQSDKILVVPKRMKFTAIAKTVPAMTVSMVSWGDGAESWFLKRFQLFPSTTPDV